MGFADDDADSLELGSMPPLPRPRAPPSIRSPLSMISGDGSGGSSAKQQNHRASPGVSQEQSHDEWMMVEKPAPAPVPHAHPLRGWAAPTTSAAAAGVGKRAAGNSAALMERLSKPVRSRDVDIKRLNATFLNRDRVAAFANATGKENVANNAQMQQQDSEKDSTVVVQPHSTRLLQKRIEQVEQQTTAEKRPLGEEELRYAATDATQLRQNGYGAMDDPRSIAASTGAHESALERARTRKVKKQVDAKWLQSHTDPSLRPRGPLERPDEMPFYDSVYRATMQELLDEGVLFDEDDRKSAFTVTRKEWDELAHDKRATTGLCGSCFDEWSFH